MGVFDKITHIIDLQQNNTKKQAEEYIFPPEKEKEIRNLIKESARIVFPQPNDDVEFIVPLFNAQKHYKKLKRMIWKNGKIR